MLVFYGTFADTCAADLGLALSGLPIRAALKSGLFVKGLRDACAADATDPIYLDLFHKVPLKRRIRPAQLLP
jgi:hypothetical protein